VNAWASTPLEHWGVAGRVPKTRESRRRRRRGSGVWGEAVPLPRKFMNFSSQNGVISCILGVLFLRFMCHSAPAACDECSGSSYHELVVARPREASSEAASLAAG